MIVRVDSGQGNLCKTNTCWGK